MKSRLLLFLILLSGSLEAQVVRTWVSGSGSDANPCTRALPCRNFAAAVAAVDADGEVVVLDSAGYGSVVVNKDVSIIAPQGFHAAVAPTSGIAIEIAPSTFATLRNLYLNSQGASIGIQMGGTGGLHVESCTVAGFGGTGIRVINGGSEVFVSDTIVRTCGTGITVSGSVEPVLAQIARVQSRGHLSRGILVVNAVRAVITDCSLAANEEAQLSVVSSLANPVVDIEDTVLMGSGVSTLSAGISVFADPGTTGTIRVSRCLITNNEAGIDLGGGGGSENVLSRGDNTVEGNATNQTFTGTFNPK